MTTVIFTTNYSDLSGSYRAGWKCRLPADLAAQLIASGTAMLAEQETEPVGKPKRVRKSTPDDQYVAPSTPVEA